MVTESRARTAAAQAPAPRGQTADGDRLWHPAGPSGDDQSDGAGGAQSLVGPKHGPTNQQYPRLGGSGVVPGLDGCGWPRPQWPGTGGGK